MGWDVENTVLALLVAAVLGLLGWMVYVIYDEHIHCIRYEQQLVHHPGWVQYIEVGKQQTPIFHAAYNVQWKTCAWSATTDQNGIINLWPR